MPLKKLQFENLADDYLGIESDIEDSSLAEFRGKPFWCFNKGNGKDCCFNHQVGLPLKKGADDKVREHPIYDYEMEIFDAIEQQHHIWCKKARGIGFTTFMIRYLAWKCLVNDDLAKQNIFIATGTEAGFAKELKDKIAELFDRNYSHLRLDVKYNELVLNKTRFKSFPTMNLKDMRVYTDVAFIFVDEADYYKLAQQEEIGAVIRSYEEKSNAKIVMVSTPYRPDGLFHAIENDEAFKGFFKKLPLLYHRGLDKIFDRKQIEKMKLYNPDFDREYGGMYLGRIGNVFPPEMVDACQDLGNSIAKEPPNQYADYCIGVDFGFNISKSVICVGQWYKDQQVLRVVELEDFGSNPTMPSIVAETMWQMYQKYGPNTHFFVDGSNAGTVNEIKVKFGEGLSWRDRYKKGVSKSERVHPINFGTEQEDMIKQMYDMVAKGVLAVPSQYDKLIIAMRTAQVKEWKLDKEESVNTDYLDAARLMCYIIRWNSK